MNFRELVLKKEGFCLERAQEGDFHIGVGVGPDLIATLGIMLTSIARNNTKRGVHMYFLATAIEKKDLDRLQKMVEEHKNICLEILYIDAEAVKRIIGEGMPVATFYRLLLPRVLDPSVKKAVFVDVDALCLGSLDEFEKYSFDGKAFMAVHDTLSGNTIKQHRKDIGIPADSKYFNAGCLYIDIDRWNELELTEKAFQTAYEWQQQGRFLWFFDQDALNIVAHDQWKELPYKFNLMIPVLREKLHGKLPEDTVIIHFAACYKPWSLWTPEGDDFSKYCVELDIYNDYRSKSLWADFKGKPMNTMGKRLFSKWMLMQGNVWLAIKWQWKYLKDKLSSKCNC